jgi:hypothetical protein
VSGSLPPGLALNNSTGVISGSPTTVGTTTFYIQVKDSAIPNPATYPPNGSGLALTININEVFVNEDLSGNYAFLVSGLSNGKNFMAVGSFLASDGSITDGIMDTNEGGTVQTRVAFSGTSSLGGNGVGTITFPPLGRTFALSFVPTGGSPIQNANLIEFDNTGVQASGVLLQQTTSDFSAALTSGSFAFGFQGSSGTGQRYGLAGSFSGTSGRLDSDGGVTPQIDTAFTVSALVSADPTSGRGTMAFSVGAQAANYAYYVVNSQQMLVIEIDSAPAPSVSGSILQQSGTFGASSLTGVVFETTALPSGTALSQLGLLTTDGSGGHLSTSFNNNTSPTGATQMISGGTYAVDAITGRTTLTGSGLQASSDPVLYLVQPNQGFLVGNDTAVTFGFMKGQSPPLTLSGTYAGGSLPPILLNSTCTSLPMPCPYSEVDAASADGSGILTLTSNASTAKGTLQQGPLSLGYSLPSPLTNGRGTIPPSGNPTDIFYVLSSTEYWDLSVNTSGMIRIFQASCNPNCDTQ